MLHKKSLIAILVGAAFMFSFTAPLQEKKPWDIPAKYKKMKNPYADEAEDLAEAGEDIFAKQCASCHGDEGLGDGPKASNLKTYPGDFSSDEFKALSDGELYYMSIVGRGEMPNFQKKLSDDEDQWAVIEYIKSL